MVAPEMEVVGRGRGFDPVTTKVLGDSGVYLLRGKTACVPFATVKNAYPVQCANVGAEPLKLHHCTAEVPVEAAFFEIVLFMLCPPPTTLSGVKDVTITCDEVKSLQLGTGL